VSKLEIETSKRAKIELDGALCGIELMYEEELEWWKTTTIHLDQIPSLTLPSSFAPESLPFFLFSLDSYKISINIIQYRLLRKENLNNVIFSHPLFKTDLYKTFEEELLEASVEEEPMEAEGFINDTVPMVGQRMTELSTAMRLGFNSQRSFI
jgi:hypothetical protein